MLKSRFGVKACVVTSDDPRASVRWTRGVRREDELERRLAAGNKWFAKV
jgi:hypothetical protein